MSKDISSVERNSNTKQKEFGNLMKYNQKEDERYKSND